MRRGASPRSDSSRAHPRVLGWLETVALAMGGSNQSLFILGALFLAQGSAAVPLLIVGLLLSWAALPGWTELICMWPNRVGGISATCAEAFRPYSPILANLTGVSYWWGWIPTCGLTAILAADAVHSWYLPGVPTHLLASAIVAGFAILNLRGIKCATRTATAIGAASASLALLSSLVPVASGHTDWHHALEWHLQTPFHGAFGALTSTMAGLYLIGFAAPAFEAAACHVGETRDPARNVPKAMFGAATMATLYFLVLPVVWLGAVGAHPLEGDLTHALGPTFAPLFGAGAKSLAVWFMVTNMLHGTLQPLAGAARTLSQLADDGLLPRSLSRRNRYDAPVTATLLTAGMSIAFLLSDDPPPIIAAANFTYLIGICLPSVAVWLLRRNQPDLERPWRAPRGTVTAGVIAAGAWAAATVFGFEQFGLSYVLLGLLMAYSGSFAYAFRKWRDRRDAGQEGVARVRLTLHAKLAGAMIGVMLLDGSGYLLAVHHVGPDELALVTVLQDIFVAVALLTVSVGLVLPGVISHSVTEVAEAARRLAHGPLTELSTAMVALGEGRLDEAHATPQTFPVSVRTRDEVGVMAEQFNVMQERVQTATEALARTRQELAGSQQRLQFLADHDALTELPNRRRFEHELQRALDVAKRRRSTYALVLLDLDNFKMVNDTRGHAFGDMVLRRVAAILRRRLRATDVVARLGGDEFAVILADVDVTRATELARTLVEEIASTLIVPDTAARPVRVQASAGIAVFDGAPGQTLESLLVDADVAMYDAKDAGRNRVVVAGPDAVARERMQTRQSWVEAIRFALENDGFELWAQPIMHLSTRTVTRHELLLRMHVGEDLAVPGSFLPVAEQVGLISEVDAWVVQAAFRYVRSAVVANDMPCVQVNLSGASLTDARVIELIERELAAGGAPAQCFTFEVTETAAIADVERAREFAVRLRRVGCRFALDDFGSGFGSFYYLKHLPFDFLKIDGEFVRGIVGSTHDRHVVAALVQIAQALQIQTVAEFVEDPETVELLEELGVTYAQGYAVGRPEPLRSPAAAPGVPAMPVQRATEPDLPRELVPSEVADGGQVSPASDS